MAKSQATKKLPGKRARCVICGSSPTVRSHLFPRSLVRRIRGSDKHVVEGDRSRPGYRLSQAGLWDDELLCDLHEQSLGRADDYAARFCRAFDKSQMLSDVDSYTIPNPHPELLLRFACATIWRHVRSRHGSSYGLDLGPYRQAIEEYLFGDAPLELQAILGRADLVSPVGKRIEVGIAPYKLKLRDWTIWHFAIGGFDFYVKMDKRPFPSDWTPFLLNDNDPVVATDIGPHSIHDLPKYGPIFSQMLKKRRRG